MVVVIGVGDGPQAGVASKIIIVIYLTLAENTLEQCIR